MDEKDKFDITLTDVTSIGDTFRRRDVVRVTPKPRSLRPQPGTFYCTVGDGGRHDDPDNSGLCIYCKGVTDGGPLSPTR